MAETATKDKKKKKDEDEGEGRIDVAPEIRDAGTQADLPSDEQMEDLQEKNDALKADRGGTGTGIKPVVSEVNPYTPRPVSADADSDEQERQVALQSPAGRVALKGKGSKTKITTSDGTVEVPVAYEQAEAKLRDGGLVRFKARGDDEDVVVQASDVRKIEPAGSDKDK